MSQDNFTGQNISSTFQRLLQLSDNGSYVTDGTGSVIQLLAVTSSQALTASYVAGITTPIVPIGPDGAIQLKNGSNLTGSSALLWDTNTNAALTIIPYNNNDSLRLGLGGVYGNDIGLYNGSDGILAALDATALGGHGDWRYSGGNYRFAGDTLTHQFTGSVDITGSFGLMSYGTTAPTGTPAKVGLFYFTDTDLYISLE